MERIDVSQLDKASLDYLARIDRTEGADGNGAFVRRAGARPNPRSLQVVLLVVGLLGLGAAFAGYFLFDFAQGDLREVGYFQAGLLALCGGLFVGALLALRRPIFRSP